MKNLTFFTFFMMGVNLFAQTVLYEKNEVLVRLIPGVQPEAIYAADRNLKVNDAELVSSVMNIWRLKVGTERFTEKQFVNELYKNPKVIDAQLNHKLSLRENTPNDPRYNQQWQYYQPNDKDIDADLAWEITTGGYNTDGDEIVVAVLDGGINANHPDLKDNLYVNRGEIPGDGIDNDGNGYIDDINGWNFFMDSNDINTNHWHGTPVSGIVGAVGNNGIGVAGVNWKVKIMSIVYNAATEADIIKGYDYALQARIKFNETNGEQGAFVVVTNSSWGFDMGQPADAPLWCDFFDTMGEHGILSAGATANANFNIDVVGDLPTACPSEYLLAVTNTNRNDVKVEDAGYGATTIDLGAPGQGTYTTVENSNYGTFGGTSAATPHVAGTIALLYSTPCIDITALSKSNPSAAAKKIRDYIFQGVDPNESLAGITVTGGRLNMNNSVRLLMDECENVMDVEDVKLTAKVEISPNPAKDQLSILVKGGKNIKLIELYGIDGKLIKSQKDLISRTIDISSLSKGVYQLRIQLENEKSVITKKFIKN